MPYLSRRRKPSEWEKKQAWLHSPEGLAKYTKAERAAQALSDADGFDRLIEVNYLFREVTFRLVPPKRFRMGYEVTGHVVMCTDSSKCQPGHGPRARHDDFSQG